MVLYYTVRRLYYFSFCGTRQDCTYLSLYIYIYVSSVILTRLVIIFAPLFYFIYVSQFLFSHGLVLLPLLRLIETRAVFVFSFLVLFLRFSSITFMCKARNVEFNRSNVVWMHRTWRLPFPNVFASSNMVLFVCLHVIERAGSVSSSNWCPVKKSTIVVGSTVGASRLFCTGRTWYPVEETRHRQQRTDCLRGAHEGLGLWHRSQVLPRCQLPRRK